MLLEPEKFIVVLLRIVVSTQKFSNKNSSTSESQKIDLIQVANIQSSVATNLGPGFNLAVPVAQNDGTKSFSII